MATILDIIQGIAQAAASAHDGSHDERFTEKGKAKKIGLRREDGCAINDSRVMDGFGVKFAGQTLTITYHSEVPLSETHEESKFETEIERKFKAIVKFLKKEYQQNTKKNLALTSQGDASIRVQSMSRVRSWVEASKTYKIGGVKGMDKTDESSDGLDDSIKKWLAIGKDKYPKAKKSQNDKR